MSHYPEEYEKDSFRQAINYRTPEGLYDMKEASEVYKLGTTCDRNKAPESLNGAVSPLNKYSRVLRSGATLDVYDVLDAFKVENPAVQHALKKMLCSGSRGYKDYQTDIQEAIDSLERAKAFTPIPF
jgi:hypothetical protein